PAGACEAPASPPRSGRDRIGRGGPATNRGCLPTPALWPPSWNRLSPAPVTRTSRPPSGARTATASINLTSPARSSRSSPPSRSVPFRDVRGGRDDLAVGIRPEEEAVGDRG